MIFNKKIYWITGFILCSGEMCYSQKTQPNVILILADDLGYGDLSCYNKNSGINTPNIDKLAEEGVRFTQFYAPSNVCSPSRRALLTGRYQSRLGEWAEAYPGIPSGDAVSKKAEPVFAQYLKKAGYTNGSFGKWNIGNVNGISTPDAHGFDYWIGSFHNHSYFGHRRDNGILDFWENGNPAPQYEGQYSDDVFFDKAIDFIKNNKKSPFFVYLPLCTPHTPYQDPAIPTEGESLSWWNKKDGGNSVKEKLGLEYRPILKKMVEHIDNRIGDLMQLLTDLNLDENTLILFASDNGGTPTSYNTPLKGYKQGVSEGGIRVPAIMKWKGVYPEGVVSSQVGILMDFSKTIIMATQSKKYIPKRRKLDGIDLTPVLTGKIPEVERELGWRRRDFNYNKDGFNNVWAEAYIKGDWKYIREFKETPGFARSVKSGYPQTGYLELLYNLKDDISEQQNMAETNTEKTKEMSDGLDQWKLNVLNKNNHYDIPALDQYEKMQLSR